MKRAKRSGSSRRLGACFSTRRAGEQGFTLLEVLLAAAIFTIGLLALSAISISVVSGNYRSRQLTIATTLAQSKIEELRGRGYANLPEQEVENPVPGYEGFKRTTDVDPPLELGDEAAPVNTKRITVTVEWNTSAGTTPSVTVSTYISR